MTRWTGLTLAALGLLAPPPAAAAAGGADHPLVSRFPGSEIRSSEVDAFDELTLPAGIVRLKPVTPSRSTAEPTRTLRLEGKVTRIVYDQPKGRSSLEIFRSYQQALGKVGFETLFACAGAECADPGTNEDLPEVGRWCVQGLDCSEPMRYLVARRNRPEGDVVVAVKVLVNEWSTGGTVLDVVEVRPMTEDQVVVRGAAEMRGELGTAGHTSVYGIRFDSGEAVVRPESDPTLEQIVELLAENPAMRLHVVGHTDNVGSLASNLTLSKQRADAVVATLVRRFGVAAARLEPAGVGPLSPVTTNRTPEGRAKNRRVELVEP